MGHTINPRWRKHARTDAGASLAEYAIGFSLVVAAAVVTFQFLTNAAEQEAANQADCISSRPPPPTCVREPVPATATSSPTSSVPTTSSSTPPSTDSTLPPPTTAPPPRSTATWGSGVATANPNGLTWDIAAPVRVVDPGGTPVSGAVVAGVVVIGRQSFGVECRTDAAGTCTLTFADIDDAIPNLTLTLTRIQAEPPAATPYPSPLAFTKP